MSVAAMDLASGSDGPAIASHSLSPMMASRDRAVARSPLPSLEQLRARILHEREAAGLQRSASTSAASQAARAYALEKLLGTSSTDRFYDHSREGTLIERGAATPSPTFTKPGEPIIDDDDEGMASDGAVTRSPRQARASLRRSRTIGGLSAMAERQRKAAFVEGVFLAVPGANSNRLSRARQQILGLRDAKADPAEQSTLPPSLKVTDNEEQDQPLASGEASVSRSVSQRQIARTEMMRKLSTRGRGNANASDVQAPSQPSSTSHSISPSPLSFASGASTAPVPFQSPLGQVTPAAAAAAAVAAAQLQQQQQQIQQQLQQLQQQQMWSTFAAAVPQQADGLDTAAKPADWTQMIPPAMLFAQTGFGYGAKSNLFAPGAAAHGGAEESGMARLPLTVPNGHMHDTSHVGQDGQAEREDASRQLELKTQRQPLRGKEDDRANSDSELEGGDDGSDFDEGGDEDLDEDGFFGLYGSRDGESEDDGVDQGGHDVKGIDRSFAAEQPGGVEQPARLQTRSPLVDDADQSVPPLPSRSEAPEAASSPGSRSAVREQERLSASPKPPPAIQTIDLDENRTPSTPPTQMTSRHRASVPYDSSPANELEVGDLRKSSFMTISPSGVNLPFRLFDHDSSLRPGPDAPSSISRSQMQGSWPLSVDSLASSSSRRESEDVMRSSGGSARLGDNSLRSISGLSAVSGTDEHAGPLSASPGHVAPTACTDQTRAPPLLPVPSRQPKPSERLHAILGSSFVEQFADDRDFDNYSATSLRIGDENTQSLALDALPYRSDDMSLSSFERGTDSYAATSGCRGAAQHVGSTKSPQNSDDGGLNSTVDIGYARRVHHMADRFGHRAREMRGKRIDGQPEASLRTVVPQEGLKADIIISTGVGQRGASCNGAAHARCAEPERLPPRSQLPVRQGASPESHRTPDREVLLSTQPRPAGADPHATPPSAAGLPASAPSRRLHSHQASIDSLITALDASGTLSSTPSLSRAASARAAVRGPTSETNVAMGPTVARTRQLLSDDKLAPFPGLVPKRSENREVGCGEVPESAYRPAPSAPSNSYHALGQAGGSTQPIPAPPMDPALTTEHTRLGKASDMKADGRGFFTSLRRKASGAFVGQHSRTASKDGFWARKGSIKRSASSAKADRVGHALKIEHPHHIGGPVQIIPARRAEVGNGSPASLSAGDSPDPSQPKFRTSPGASRFREDLEDGTADAAPSAAAAAIASEGLAPSTVAMVHRYSRMLTAKDVASSVPGVSAQAGQDPPRKLILNEPVFQVISATTIKDRYLFLFSDILVIAKPVARGKVEAVSSASQVASHQTRLKLKGTDTLPNIQWTFSVKNVLELSRLKVSVNASSKHVKAKSRARNPILLAFVEHFSRDADEALRSLLSKTKLQDSNASIAQLLYQTPELDRAALTAYLTEPTRRELLAAYIDQHRLVGVSIESGLRSLLLDLRFPDNATAFEIVLILFAKRWVACNATLVKPGFTFELAVDLVFAIMALNDALHSARPGTPELSQPSRPANATTPGFFSEPCRMVSKEEFQQVFRQHDPKGILSDRTLGRIYLSVRSEPIAQALDADEPRRTIRIKGGILPTRLTYGQASEPVTVCIAAVDPDLAIRLYAQDATFDPPILTFDKSREASFTMSSKSLGQKQIIFVRAGRNARYYTGTELDDHRTGQSAQLDAADVPLPRSLNVTVERAFMKHSFTVTSLDQDGERRHFMLSFESDDKMQTWLRAIELASARSKAVGLGITDGTTQQHMEQQLRARRAAAAIALHVLRDTLIARDPADAAGRTSGLSRSATVHVPTITIPSGPNQPSTTSPLDRQASTSRHYYAGGGVGQHERDLLIPSSFAGPAEMKRGGSSSSQQSQMLRSTSGGSSGVGGGHTKGAASLSLLAGQRGHPSSEVSLSPSQSTLESEATANTDMCDEAIVTICRQNSLLPLVISQLEAFGADKV